MRSEWGIDVAKICFNCWSFWHWGYDQKIEASAKVRLMAVDKANSPLILAEGQTKYWTILHLIFPTGTFRILHFVDQNSIRKNNPTSFTYKTCVYPSVCLGYLGEYSYCILWLILLFLTSIVKLWLNALCSFLFMFWVLSFHCNACGVACWSPWRLSAAHCST